MTTGSRKMARGQPRPIKTEQDNLTTTSSQNGAESVHTQINGALDSAGHSLYSATDVAIPVDQSFVKPNGRSDAPTPSERFGDGEPLLREVRARHSMPAVASHVSQDEDSFFHSSFKDIGKKLKACNDTLGELQQLGVSHDVQLPELVLVGDQSAGKSSLMSGLAHLDLPRSEGTCTRCPLHIRVSRNTEWSCRVWLRKEYVYSPPDGRQILETDVTQADPFFPWKKKRTSDIHEFKTMHDNSEIEEVLRWAQIAILNDHRAPALFVPGSGSIAMNTAIAKASEETSAKFSPNIVALEIKGPELPDLSFYDMPGIFQNPADARDDYLVSVVRNLSRAYIQHPSAIIMCSMPMNTDAENSSTFGLTRKLGAANRTIGVLTKADLLPADGNHDQWLSIMNGESHQTGLGYFITSRPQGKDLEELKKWEQVVFDENSLETWPADFRDFEERCGVERLKVFLSERLGEEFAKSLPNIKRKVKNQLDKVKNDLFRLPELPRNVELEVQNCLTAFNENSRKKIDGFAESINSLSGSFRDCLLHIKPKFILKDKSDNPVVEISDDESDAGSVATTQTTPTGKRGRDALQQTPSKRQRVNSSVNGSFTNGHIKPEDVASHGGTPRRPVAHRRLLPAPFTEFSKVGSGFRTLREVQQEVERKMRAGFPAVIGPGVYEDLVLEAIKPWEGPVKAFLREIMRLLQKDLNDALAESLERLKKRRIYREASKHLKKLLEKHMTETEDALMLLYRDETQQLMTLNKEAFDQYYRDEKTILIRFRHQMRMEAKFPTNARKIDPWEALTPDQQAQDVKQRDAESAKLGPDSLMREVEVVAFVRGYYRLAALRFADTVSQSILCRMIPSIRRDLSRHLEENLGLVGPNSLPSYTMLMEEDELIAARREALKAEKEKFERALESIEDLERGTVADDVPNDTSSISFAQSVPDALIRDSQATSDGVSGEC